MTTPAVDRPIMPDGYGVPESAEGQLNWEQMEERLHAATEFWLATTRPDGRPHVVPRWGAWLDGRFYYDGSPQTRHARNIVRNPAAVLHLESGTDVLIIEGESRPSEPVPLELGTRIAAEFGRKYGAKGYAPEPAAWSGPDAGGLCVFTPKKALAWTTFPSDATRFTFA
jgi:hypothetical protein